MASLLIACGGEDRPEFDASASTQAKPLTASNEAKSTGTPQPAETNDKAPVDDVTPSTQPPATVETTDPNPPATPPPAKLAIRTVPNAAELSAMTTLYGLPSAQGGCAECHGALAASAKKGRSAATLAAAATRTNHRTPAAAKVWPVDTADSTDDGIDQAKLLASALAQLLK